VALEAPERGGLASRPAAIAFTSLVADGRKAVSALTPNPIGRLCTRWRRGAGIQRVALSSLDNISLHRGRRIDLER
jgi:hypothetical protein